MLPFEEEQSSTEALPFEQEGSSKGSGNDAEYNRSRLREASNYFLKYPVAALETGASMVAGIPSQIWGGLKGLSTYAATGDVTRSGNAVDEAIQNNFGFGAWQPKTESGKAGAEGLANLFSKPGEWAGDLGAAIGRPLGNEELGRLTLKLPTDTAMNFLPVHGVKAGAKGAVNKTINTLYPREQAKPTEVVPPKQEVVKPPIDESMQMELPFENTLQQAAELKGEALGQRDLFAPANQNLRVNPETPPVVENPLLGDSILRPEIEAREMQPALDAQRALDERQAQLEFEVAKQQGLDFNAAERARQLEQPTGYSDWVEQMRNQQRIPGDNTPLDIPKGLQLVPKGEEGGYIPPGQRGAINVEALQEGYNQLKELADGTRLAYYGDKERPKVVAFDKDGNVVGNLDLSPTDYVGDPKPTDNLTGMWVDSSKKGTAAEMYQFAAEQGHDIVPSKAQTAAGKAMWDKFEKQGLSENKIIYGKRDQRGGVDFKAITDEVSKGMRAFNQWNSDRVKIDFEKAAPPDKNDFAKQIPGMAKAVDGIIPRPKDAASLIEAGLQAGDIPNIWENAATGPEMVGAKYKNPLVSGVSSWLQWADKKSSYATKTLVRPIERSITSLSPKGMIDLADVLKTEMFAKERMTPEQLSEAGLKPEMVEKYNELRNAFDTVYELQSKALTMQGKRVPTKQEAYLASIRGGNYHVNVKAPDGSTAWHIQARSKSEATKAINWLKDNAKDIDTSKLKVEYRSPNRLPGVPTDTLGGFQEMLKLVDDNSDSAMAIKEALREAQEKAGYNYGGQSNRFLRKNNVRGFEGDMPWLSPKENANRLLQNQIDYLNDSYKWAYLNDALGEVKNVLADERVVSSMPNASSYLKEVVRQQLGIGDNLARKAEEAVMSRLGLSRSHLSGPAHSVGAWTSMLQLGASTGYAIATPLTALFSTALHLREGTLSPKVISNSLMDASAGIVQSIMSEKFPNAQMPMTELGQAALQYAKDNGIITEHMLGDTHRIGENKLMNNAVKRPLEYTITMPERIQRLSTFMAFVHGLKEKGGYSNVYDLFQKAETLTNLAATNFRPGELPMMVNKGGVLGAAAFKYKAPMINYYNQLHMYAMDAKKGNYKPLLGLLGVTAVLGGVQNLPGINEIDGAWNLVKDAVAKLSPENYGKVSDVDVKDFIRNNVGDAAAYGAVQKLTGAQMSQRFGTDLANVEDPLKNAFPALSMVENMAGAVGSAAKGDFTQAAWNMAPQSVRGNMEVGMDRFRGLQPGSFRKPSDLNNPDIQQIRNTTDETYRKFGLRSADEARRLESSAKVNKEQQRITTALNGNMEKLVNAATKGDQEGIQKYAQAWLKLNPDDAAFQSALSSRLDRAVMSPEQRELARAKTILQVQKIMRLRNARN
jgi:hypothetical protein